MGCSMAQAGYYCKRLNAFINEEPMGSSASIQTTVHDYIRLSRPDGNIRRTVLRCMREQLGHYYDTLASLEDNIKGNKQHVTLKLLWIWLRKPLRSLQNLHEVAQTCLEFQGAEIITALYAMSIRSDVEEAEVLTPLLTAACGPLITMAKQWIELGQVSDKSEEFFVHVNDLKDPNPDSIWSTGCSLIESAVPLNLPSKLAHRIFYTGKSIHFLRCVWPDFEPYPGSVASTNGPSIWGDLAATVDAAEASANEAIMDTMIKRFSLLGHFEALTKFVLLSMGDFVRELFDSIVYSNKTSVAVESAIRNSNGHLMGEEFHSRLDGIRGAPNNGKGGYNWGTRSMSLTYTLGTHPASVIFDDMSLYVYKTASARILRIKHLLYTLSRCWIRSRGWKGEHNIFTLQYHGARHEMTHFLTTIDSYISYDMIDKFSKKFSSYISNSKNHTLDDVKSLHSALLHDLATGLFLIGGPHSAQAAPATVSNIMDHVLDIVQCFIEEDTLERYDVQYLEHLRRTFRVAFLELYRALHEWQMVVEETVVSQSIRTLLAHLDFNECYGAERHVFMTEAQPITRPRVISDGRNPLGQ
eukprot:GHVO01038933.1.p1 GENE.GHVO01038933.1~~GHVO01038933.1.p1  ORF type:complete len:583 (+),score=89.05 GHVO01038933.1:2-1750(+)